MKEKVLVTGASGFLGGHYLHYCVEQGFDVYAIGNTKFKENIASTTDVVSWCCDTISVSNLLETGVSFSTIVHCAGGSSVAKSFESPQKDFDSTVISTLEILEYVRLHSKNTQIVYPSSAAVYGESSEDLNRTSDKRIPTSPYGVHKALVEDLCQSYKKFYGLDISIIRFFSIYGPELRKQLIWDACIKLKTNQPSIEFWGTGKESRDWLFISDAVNLIATVSQSQNAPFLINGGSGKGHTIQQVLYLLTQLFERDENSIRFIGEQKTGDPSHYLADIREASMLNWQPKTSLKDGLCDYVKWFNGNHL